MCIVLCIVSTVSEVFFFPDAMVDELALVFLPVDVI